MRSVSIVLGIVVLFLLQSCTNSGVAPVQERSEVKEPVPGTTQRDSKFRTKKKAAPTFVGDGRNYYVVDKDDTLYSIAWHYNQDYKDIAVWNRIQEPYTIYPGQIIYLESFTRPTEKSLPTRKTKPPLTEVMQKKVHKSAAVSKKTNLQPRPIQKKKRIAVRNKESKTALPTGLVKWSWPTFGKLVHSNLPTSQKGIDITGKTGQTVKAAAYGEVVYSGSGLLGYGKLIIIKHNETYLSAYAYNSKLLVKEGDRVNAGQVISYMGKDNIGRTVLHFEIRKNGKPVNPIKYLPKKSA